MLYDPERFIVSGDVPFSTFLAMARAHRSMEEVKTGLFGDGATALPGHFFEPLSGFHFGMCGPVTVPSPISSEFYCDIPAIIGVVLLGGEWECALNDASSPPVTLRKNMFLLSDWESMRGFSAAPPQEDYCHVAVVVEKGSVGRHFGEKAEKEMGRTLADVLGGSRIISGPASPDVLACAKNLLHMHKQGPLATMSLRGTVIDFYTRLLKNAAEQDPAPAAPLHERDALVLTTLKERIEKNCTGLTAKELCAVIGMSESKANKGFKILFGTTIAKHLHACKMARAHALLTRKKHTVSECAMSLGYTNIGHFIAAFRKHYGMTPKKASRTA